MFMRIFITRQLTFELLSKIRIRKTHETSIVVLYFHAISSFSSTITLIIVSSLRGCLLIYIWAFVSSVRF